jgi:hypothetical protein
MGNLTNQYVSQSYQGLLTLADSNNGVTNTLQYVTDGLGNNTALQISETEVNITGSLLVNGLPITGATGSSGTSGSSGSSGVNGSSGTSGSSGQSGSSGTSGSSGASGASGSSGTSGSSGVSGTSGTSGTSATDAESAQVIKLYVKNQTGAQLDLGKIVRITGSTGDNAIVGLADWSDDANSANTLGMVSSSIANDDFGYVITTGRIIGINTSGMTAGQMLYLSSSGQFTNVTPPAPYHEVRLGQVLRPQQNNGSMYVSIMNGYELNELHDVNLTNPQTGDLLAYNSGSGQWENETNTTLGLAITGSNTFSGDQTISGSIKLHGDIILDQVTTGNPSEIKIYQGDAVATSGGKIQFYSGSAASPVGGWVNMQVNPANGALAISSFPQNNHFLDFDVQQTASLFTAPIGGLTGTLTFRGNLLLSGSNANNFRVSSSLAGGGITTMSPSGLLANSGSLNGNVSKTVINHTDSTGSPTTNKYIGMSANPSVIGAPTLTGTTVPSIIAMNGSAQPEAVVSFQHRGSYTDGRMTVLKPLQLNSGSFITGSINGNVQSIGINSSTASFNLDTGNFFVVPFLAAGNDVRFEFSGVKPGQTVNVKVIPQSNNTVSFGPNVQQPSGSSYVPTATSGSVDILTLVSFDSSTLQLVGSKNFI